MEQANLSPLFCEIMKNMAYLRTLGLVMLTDEQLVRFHNLYESSLKAVLNEFINDYPDLFAADVEELKRFFTRNMN